MLAEARVEERRRCLLEEVLHQWAYVVEKRKGLVALDESSPYHHLDTDDERYVPGLGYVEDWDSDTSSEWPDGCFYQVAKIKIRLPKPGE